jgi:Major Facilitator Superfamily
MDFDHHALADGERVELGNTVIEAIATPGHARAHHAYVVSDRRRADEPWLVLTGDALLVGDAGRPDLHARGEHTVEEMARTLYRSLTQRLPALPDHLVLFPSHYAGSVCGRGLSATPVSTVGFERRHNPALQFGSEDAFVEALMRDIPPALEQQRSWRPTAAAARSPRSHEPVAGPSRAARERGAVLAAGRRQRVRRCMVGLERSTLPLIGRQDFHLASSAAVLSFIVAFGVVKALTNLAAGTLAQRAGRRRVLIAGWAAALPVPLLIATAPRWAWIVAANALLGVNQGLAWSMTVVMKINLVGPKRRGLALRRRRDRPRRGGLPGRLERGANRDRPLV